MCAVSTVEGGYPGNGQIPTTTTTTLFPLLPDCTPLPQYFLGRSQRVTEVVHKRWGGSGMAVCISSSPRTQSGGVCKAGPNVRGTWCALNGDCPYLEHAISLQPQGGQ